MIREEDIIADMHAHTMYSKHAFSTVKENIDKAKERGIKFLVVSDHLYQDGSWSDKLNEYYRIIDCEGRVNPYESGFKVIGSTEFNIGAEVQDKRLLTDLKWRPIGLHGWFVSTKDIDFCDLFNLYKEAVKDGFNCFVHIERGLSAINHYKNGKRLTDEVKDYLEKIVDLARANDVYLEVNEGSIKDRQFGNYNLMLMEYWLDYAKEVGCRISLGSDAHYCSEVGQFNNVLTLLNDVGYPKELIINCNEKALQSLVTYN